MKHGYEEQVPDDIDDAGNSNKDERHDGISKSPEDAADDVVGDDEEDASAAYTDIGYGLFHGLLGSLHDMCKWAGKNRQQDGQHEREDDKEPDSASD